MKAFTKLAENLQNTYGVKVTPPKADSDLFMFSDPDDGYSEGDYLATLKALETMLARFPILSHSTYPLKEFAYLSGLTRKQAEAVFEEPILIASIDGSLDSLEGVTGPMWEKGTIQLVLNDVGGVNPASGEISSGFTTVKARRDIVFHEGTHAIMYASIGLHGFVDPLSETVSEQRTKRNVAVMERWSADHLNRYGVPMSAIARVSEYGATAGQREAIAEVGAAVLGHPNSDPFNDPSVNRAAHHVFTDLERVSAQQRRNR